MNQDDFLRLLVMQQTVDTAMPLTSKSVFLIAKFIEMWSGKAIRKRKQLVSGGTLIEVKNKEQSGNLLKQTNIGDLQITSTSPNPQ